MSQDKDGLSAVNEARQFWPDGAAIRYQAGVVAASVPVYYERFGPAQRDMSRPTVVMLHGGSHSGSCFQVTADGRPGWAMTFVQHSYDVVVPDWPGCGRSGAVSPDALDAAVVVEGLSALLTALDGPLVLLAHSMGGPYAWRLAEIHRARVSAVVGVAPGPPGNIQPVPEILSESDEETEIATAHRRFRLPKHGFMPNDRAFVEDKLVGESRFFPREHLATYSASLLHTPVSLVRQRVNLHGSQVRVLDPRAFAGMPILVLTGTADLEHPRWTDEAVARWFGQNGARAEFIWLGDRGIEGNGHMLMLESNSDAIAGIILTWLSHAARAR
ncbi:alpha/beta fold hydrolase [Roseomonas sp. BN140053]|uniref:alpha/beta fold hydrolase n=1 Tax=Roseomonas sp. BN140053 TaxID=3391898 RepID=UPI0039E893F6